MAARGGCRVTSEIRGIAPIRVTSAYPEKKKTFSRTRDQVAAFFNRASQLVAVRRAPCRVLAIRDYLFMNACKIGLIKIDSFTFFPVCLFDFMRPIQRVLINTEMDGLIIHARANNPISRIFIMQ